MKPKTKRILTLIIAMALVSPLSLLPTIIIVLPSLMTLLIAMDDENITEEGNG